MVKDVKVGPSPYWMQRKLIEAGMSEKKEALSFVNKVDEPSVFGLDNAIDGEKNIEIKKIPQSVLKDCEYGINNYDLNIINQAFEQSEDGEDNV